MKILPRIICVVASALADHREFVGHLEGGIVHGGFGGHLEGGVGLSSRIGGGVGKICGIGQGGGIGISSGIGGGVGRIGGIGFGGGVGLEGGIEGEGRRPWWRI